MILAAVAAALALAAPAPRAEISFWGGFAHAQVFVMATDGSGVRAITNLYSAKRGAWSPDGSRLAFDGRFYATVFDFDIGVMRADGSDVRRVTRGPDRDIMAAWSPDGRWLAFARQPSETADPQVWLVRPNGRGGAPSRRRPRRRLARTPVDTEPRRRLRSVMVARRAKDPVHTRTRECARRVRDERRRHR